MRALKAGFLRPKLRWSSPDHVIPICVKNKIEHRRLMSDKKYNEKAGNKSSISRFPVASPWSQCFWHPPWVSCIRDHFRFLLPAVADFHLTRWAVVTMAEHADVQELPGILRVSPYTGMPSANAHWSWFSARWFWHLFSRVSVGYSERWPFRDWFPLRRWNENCAATHKPLNVKTDETG